MNEISVSSQNEIDKSPFNNPLLLILLIPIVKNILSKNKNVFNLSIHGLNGISLTRILDKVDILIKVAPYLPADLISIINKYLPMYDRLSKAFIVMEFFSRSSTVSPIVVANELNPKEKTDRVSYILKEELSKNEYQKISPFIGVATNLDMYKGILQTLTNINNPENNSNGLENIISLMGPLLGQNQESMGKINDMMKMMDLINLFGEDEDEKKEVNENNEE
ncbi:hypothetical protein GOQ27_02070 [Clostridium sp. D2Q-11]|uniref:Uncharacterized protein n=1 Tax=Anaeromonas frigoriresistens TaxID=2683708 RepID=A0A942UVK2_9FIRM|nr:hypothetical protein [Anaeromonas frigoriresistens]MBS4537226.1 hypothetical protein [Anaeromonas frigoriresistens]